MAIVQTGSEVGFDFVVTAATGTITTALTVPADAEIAIIGISGFINTSPGFVSLTLTKGGTDTLMVKSTSADTNTAIWMAGQFYMVLPDTGTNKTLKYTMGTSVGGQRHKATITFWKGIDTASPSRHSLAVQSSTLPSNTGTLTAQSGDKIIVFTGRYSPTNTGTFDTWNNATELVEAVNFFEAGAAWATANPSGNTTVGLQSATDFIEGGLCALVLKPSSAVSTPPAPPLLLGRGFNPLRRFRQSFVQASDLPATGPAAYVMPADAGTLTLSGQNIILRYGHMLAAGLGTLTLAGQAVTFKRSYVMPAGLGLLNLSGQTVNLIYSGAGAKILPAGTGTLTLSGQNITLRYGHVNLAGLGTLTLGGQPVGLRATHLPLTAGTGTLTLSGQNVGLRFGHRLIAGTGVLTLAGQTMVPRVTLPAGLGTLALGGQPVTLRYARRMPAGTGVLTLSGQTIGLQRKCTLIANFGTLTLSGQAISFRFAHRAVLTPGSLVLAGQDVTLTPRFRQSYVLAAGTGVLVMRGNSTSLTQHSQPGVFSFGRRVTIPNRW